jgi:hypothetical protein
MIEKLQALFYEDKNSQAEAIRKYINSCGLNCKYDVSEPALTEWAYDHLAGRYTHQARIDYLLQQLRQCQDIIFSIRWGASEWNPFSKTHRHAVGLVGVDEGTGEFILNNPWGTDVHVNPDDAAHGFDQGQSNTFTKHKYKVDSSGNILIPFDGDEAVIYGAVMVCPVDNHAVAIRSEVESIDVPKAFPLQPGADPSSTRTRLSYELSNHAAGMANGFAVELTGLRVEQVTAMLAPKAWTPEIWYRERELGFDRLAPEIQQDPEARTFAGVIWRCREGGIARGQCLAGFAVELDIVSRPSDEEMPEFEIDELGHGIVLEENQGTTTAWHVNATTLVKSKPRFKRWCAES